MKTTIEMPDALFRQAKVQAAAKGITLKQLIGDLLERNLHTDSGSVGTAEPPWMQGFGGLADLNKENSRVRKLIEDEFERVEPEDLA